MHTGERISKGAGRNHLTVFHCHTLLRLQSLLRSHMWHFPLFLKWKSNHAYTQMHSIHWMKYYSVYFVLSFVDCWIVDCNSQSVKRNSSPYARIHIVHLFIHEYTYMCHQMSLKMCVFTVHTIQLFAIVAQSQNHIFIFNFTPPFVMQ